MNFLQSLEESKRAWGIPVREEKGSGYLPIPPGTTQTTGLPRDFKADELVEAYNLHSVVYACATAIAREVAKLPLLVFKRESQNPNVSRYFTQKKIVAPWGGVLYDYSQRNSSKELWRIKSFMQKDGLVPILDHDLNQLLEYVNREDDQFAMKEAMATWLAMRGNTYLEFVREKGPNKPPTELWVLPANKMRVVPGKGGEVLGYLAEVGLGRFEPILWEDLSHTKFFNPLSRFHGIGPIQAAREGLLADIYASRYNRIFFENDASPSGLLSSDQELDAADSEELRQRWSDAHRGVDKSHRIAVLGKGARYEQVSLSHKDMSYLQLRQWAKGEVMEVMNVPPIIIGDMELGHSTFDNSEAQERFFWNGVLIYVTRLEAQLNKDLASEYEDDVLIAFDTSHVEALQPSLTARLDRAYKAIRSGYSLDESRVYISELPPTGDNNVYLESTLIPTAMAPAVEDGTKTADLPPIRKATSTAKLNEPVENYLLPIDEELDAWKATLLPIWRQVITTAGEQTLDELTPNDEEPPEFILTERSNTFIAGRTDLTKEIEKKTRSDHRRVLGAAIASGLTLGETLGQIESLYDGYAIGRTSRILQTEIVSGYNFGAFEGSIQSPFAEYKRWISVLIPTTRDAHANAHGQVVKVAEPFIVDGVQMMYPGDWTAPARLVINCYCRFLPVRASERSRLPEPGEITERDISEYKRFHRQTQRLIKGNTPKIQKFFEEQKNRLIERVRELSE